MSTQTDKIRQAIERAMARIGCPPGDNSDADLYRELQSALSELEAPPSQTIGEQTPVAKPNDWSNPEFRAKTFLERMLRLREDVSRWQGKCSVLRHENNRLRAKPSPEARDKAIHALQVSRITHKAMCREDHVDMIDDALSALRGQ